MLDIKRIREDYEGCKAGVERRTKGSFGIENALPLDDKRRALLGEVEAMKNTERGFQADPQDEKGGRGHFSHHG